MYAFLNLLFVEDLSIGRFYVMNSINYRDIVIIVANINEIPEFNLDQ
ncbi:hypothetical protein SAMN02799633_02586 [Bacillus sp. UNCCL81]|nr:hypothetical protein SAMN02799633_02586 [Bacillus sp. UNCCL81]